MLGRVSNDIASGFARKGISSEDRTMVYAYGFELLLATGINIILVLCVSALFYHIYTGAFFLLAFIPLRSTAGGYHANSHLTCCLVFLGIYILCLLLLTGLHCSNYGLIYVLISIISGITIYRCSPIESGNKPMSQQLRAKNRKRSIGISCLNLILALVLCVLSHQDKWIFGSYFLGVASAAISMYADLLLNVRR